MAFFIVISLCVTSALCYDATDDESFAYVAVFCGCIACTCAEVLLG